MYKNLIAPHLIVAIIMDIDSICVDNPEIIKSFYNSF